MYLATERKSNAWLLAKTGIEPCLLEEMKKRRLSYLQHILRKEGICLEKEIIQGTTSGHWHHGRPRARWEDNITKWTGLKGDLLLQPAEDRSRWWKIVREAANPRSEDGWRQDKTFHVSMLWGRGHLYPHSPPTSTVSSPILNPKSQNDYRMNSASWENRKWKCAKNYNKWHNKFIFLKQQSAFW